MDLFILRHGEAGKRVAAENKDFDRPLTVTGQKEIADIAKSLKDLGIRFDFILSSFEEGTSNCRNRIQDI